MPKGVTTSTDAHPQISRYAQKRLNALAQGLVQPPSEDELAPLPPEKQEVRARIVSFSPNDRFLFPVTKSGEKLFLRMGLVVRLGLVIRPGDVIICEVHRAEPGKCRYITWIKGFYRRRRR